MTVLEISHQTRQKLGRMHTGEKITIECKLDGEQTEVKFRSDTTTVIYARKHLAGYMLKYQHDFVKELDRYGQAEINASVNTKFDESITVVIN